MFSAPVRFNVSLARVISSDVSQCTDSRTPPFLTRPSYRLASYSGIPIPTSAPTNPPTAPAHAEPRECPHDRARRDEWPQSWDGERPDAREQTQRASDGPASGDT